ncbi:unnamed protein product [Urochloa decumbens]|uniref:DUF7378 domain-containing protein n=1 Tax=Urochloa decumbens TaxID=240449 RepID=A0ABC9E502_9POAL
MQCRPCSTKHPPLAAMEDRGASSATPPEPVTVGESMAHRSRCDIWTAAVVIEAALIAFFVGMASALKSETSPSFFSAAPWRLALWASFGVYMSLVFAVIFYVELFLPRTPVAVRTKLTDVGVCAIGVGALNVMVAVVLSVGAKDTRVLVCCTGVVAAFVVGLVAFWGWLVGRYGGCDDPAMTAAASASRIGSSSGLAGQLHVARLPI